MIVLYSRNTDDTTIGIIKWLIRQEKDFVRINRIEEFLYGLNYDLESEQYSLRVADISLVNTGYSNSFYFLGASPSDRFEMLQGVEDSQLRKSIHDYLNQESYAISNRLFSCSLNKTAVIFGLSPFATNKINKLKTLEAARKLDIKTPLSAVVSSKKDIISYKKKWNRIISKGLDAGINIETPKWAVFGQQTIEINDELIADCSDYFFPTFIQQLVEKQFEIRTFMFKELIYSTAIFTQGNQKSMIDGRQIDVHKLNRHVPYTLPKVVENKLKQLLTALKLNYGSIDLILDKDGNYILLEVNPYGQFGYISSYGNYSLERKISEKL